MRTARRRALAAAGAALVLVAGVAFWRARLRLAESLVMRAVAAAGVAGAEVAVTEIGPRGALLEHLRVGEAAGADLEIERIALRYSVLGLLRGRLGEVAVGGLRLRGRRDDAGLSFGKLDALRRRAASPDASTGAGSLPPIDALVLQDARVEVAAAGRSLLLRMDGELALAPGGPRGRLTVEAIRSGRAPPVVFALQVSPEGAAPATAGEIPLALEVSAAEGRATLRGDGRLRLDPFGAELGLAGALVFAPGALQPEDLAPEIGTFVAAAEGTLAVRATLRAGAEGLAVTGRIETEGLDVATPSGIAITGLVGGADFAGPAPFRTLRTETLRFRRADLIGPFEEGELRFRLRGSQLEVPEASWRYAGGRLSTSGRFDLAAKEHPFTVQVADVSLARLLEWVDVPDLSGTGSLSGTLPLVFDGERLRVSEGRLSAAAPGGIVRYAPASAAEGSLGLGGDVDVLAGALRDFHYDTLRLALSGSLDGEVRVGVALYGKNPRYERGRRVELNVNLETNLASLLRAGRSVSGVPEVIERRLRGRVPSDGD